MKKLLFASMLFIAVSCNDKNEKTEVTSSDTTTAAVSSDNLEYAYTLDKPHNDWRPGDKQHVVNIMKSLKAFEMNNIPEAVSYFADTVDIRFDEYQDRISRDSLQSLFTKWRNDNASMNIKMQDWESVVSKDGKEEWVTMWYKQSWTDKKGKTDSLQVVDDAKFVNGKITVLEETIRRYQVKK